MSYDVIWHTPSVDEHGSMPLGNGEIGVNLWTENGRDVCIYVARSDAWDENGRLCKLGRLRLRLPDGALSGPGFLQRLHLDEGVLRLTVGAFAITAWVDAHHPVLRLEIIGNSAFSIDAHVELWRRDRVITESDELFAFVRQEAPHAQVHEHADEVLDAGNRAVAWCHHNRSSTWRGNLENQFLGDYAASHADEDPLLGRCFAARMEGDGLHRSGPLTLRGEDRNRYGLTVASACERTGPNALLASLQRLQASLPPYAVALPEHVAWWHAFWQRSWIHVSGDAAAEAVSRGYALQRYLLACAGRGRFPIKFNGSLFTVRAYCDGRFSSLSGNGQSTAGDWGPDWRRWGGAYWFQNTRLAYWPMVMAGDADLAIALFRMYRDCLPLARARTAAHHRCAGVVMPETITFWGTWGDGDYGYPADRTAVLAGRPRLGHHHPLPAGHERSAINGYVRHHFSGAFELVALGLDLHATSGDDGFLNRDVLPLAREYLAFYRDRFRCRGPDGRLVIWPSQALETWQEASDPLPEVAALRWVLGGLLALPSGLLDPAEAANWRTWLAELPELPTRQHGSRFLLPAKAYDRYGNCENPELYAVFPFRFYGVGKPDIEIGRSTWERRINRQTAEGQIRGGWFQDPIQAALLGLGQEAKRLVAGYAASSDAGSRFPAFWGPNFDWVPDQDHGGVLMLTLQRMVLQAEHGRLDLMPAWPQGWDVDFRLHAPGRRVVEGTWRANTWVRLEAGDTAGLHIERHAPQAG
jgi:alpha-L-fucosidase 2